MKINVLKGERFEVNPEEISVTFDDVKGVRNLSVFMSWISFTADQYSTTMIDCVIFAFHSSLIQ